MALVVRGVSKRFGTQIALENVSLSATKGVTALLGANGSGKSTLLRLLAALITPDSGEISFDGYEYARHARRLRAYMGYLPQNPVMPEGLTVANFLQHLASLRNGDADAAIRALEIEALSQKPFRELSGGELRLVGIAQTLLGSPRLLLLDELSRGLDVTERERVFRLFSGFDGIALFSTHIPDDVERIGAEWVIVLDQGKVLFFDRVEALRAFADGCVYEITRPTSTLPQLQATMVISRMAQEGDSICLRVIGQTPPADAVRVQPSLDDAYLFLKHHYKQISHEKRPDQREGTDQGGKKE